MSASRLFHKRRFSRRSARELSPGSRRRAERLISCKSIACHPGPTCAQGDGGCVRAHRGGRRGVALL